MLEQWSHGLKCQEVTFPNDHFLLLKLLKKKIFECVEKEKTTPLVNSVFVGKSYHGPDVSWEPK